MTRPFTAERQTDSDVVNNLLHITSGDCAGDLLRQTGLPGEILVWHDILYDGPRYPGWPGDEILLNRARFIEDVTGGGLGQALVLATLKRQYDKLKASRNARIVLWFDACIFDQSMLAHILTCLRECQCRRPELICIDTFPGIVPYNGLGQLQPVQLASAYDRRQVVTDGQLKYAATVDAAFATQDLAMLRELSCATDAALPWIPAAAMRWLEEQPDPGTGLGRLERLVLGAIENGYAKPRQIYASVTASDTPPQFWGDTMLWAKINGLADRDPPLVCIDGPAPRLPQWESSLDLEQFTITKTMHPENQRSRAWK